MRSCFTISCRAADVCLCVCARECVSLSVPVSLKTPELNKSLAEGVSEQETGSQLNPMWIHQLEKWRETKNVTFHLSVGLACKQKGRQTESRVGLQFFQPLLLPLSVSSPMKACWGGVSASAAGHKHFLTTCWHTKKQKWSISHRSWKTFICVLVPCVVTHLDRLQCLSSLIRLHLLWSLCCL